MSAIKNTPQGNVVSTYLYKYCEEDDEESGGYKHVLHWNFVDTDQHD